MLYNVYHRLACYFSYGTFTSATWHDRKIVIVVTSFPTSEADSDVIERSVKIGGHGEKKNFRRADAINLYNTYMGGVDVSDQKVSSYNGLSLMAEEQESL